jgi:hypothetical protein
MRAHRCRVLLRNSEKGVRFIFQKNEKMNLTPFFDSGQVNSVNSKRLPVSHSLCRNEHVTLATMGSE